MIFVVCHIPDLISLISFCKIMTFPNQNFCVINYARCGFWSNPLVIECDFLWQGFFLLMIVVETFLTAEALRNNSLKVFSSDTLPIIWR